MQLPADRATENAAPVKCLTIPSSELRKHLSPQARLFVAKVTAVEDPVNTDEWSEVLSKVSPNIARVLRGFRDVFDLMTCFRVASGEDYISYYILWLRMLSLPFTSRVQIVVCRKGGGEETAD